MNTSRTTPWRGRIVVFAGVVLVALNLRIAVDAFSPIASLIRIDVPFTPLAEDILGDIPPLAFALFGSLTPWVGRRYGLEPLLGVAMGLMVVGELARSVVHSPWMFIMWTIPIMAGAGAGNVLVPPLVKRYFPDRIGLVMAMYTAGITCSTALPPLFILSVARQTGWRPALGVWALLGLAALVPWLMVIFSSKKAGRRVSGVLSRLDPRRQVPKAERLAVPLWKMPVSWALVVAFAVNSLLSYAVYAWLPDMLMSAGCSATSASRYLAIFALGTLPLAMVVPQLTVRMQHPDRLAWVFFFGYAIGLTGLAISPGHLTLLWIIVSRFGDCFFSYSLTLIALRTRTAAGATAMSGFVQGFGYLIASIGPWGFGFLHQVTGSWHVPMWCIVALVPVQFAGGFIAARSKPVPV